MIAKHWCLALLLALVFWTGSARAETLEQVARAPQRQRVYDYAGVLSSDQRVQLRRQMLALEPQHLAQGAIVVVRRVEGASLEAFAQRLFNRWGIGERKRNNGFLILVAIDQRRWRLQTGDGLRKKISDAEASELMREAVVPSFRRKQYATGLKAAVTAIREKVSGKSRQVASSDSSNAAASGASNSYGSQNYGAPGGAGALVFLAVGFLAVMFLVIVCAQWLTGGQGGSGSGASPFGRRSEDPWRHHHPTDHSYHNSPPPPPPPPSSGGGGDYGGGSSSGGGASGGW